MDHETAVRSHAAERYLSGELSADDRDAYEAHYFSCPECAEDLKLEQTFAANARAVFLDEVVRPAVVKTKLRRRWFPMRPLITVSLAANAVMLVALGYQVLTVNRRSSNLPGFQPSFFAPPPSRSAVEEPVIRQEVPSFVLHFPAPDRYSARYSYQVLDSSGTQEVQGSITAPVTRDPDLYLVVPTASFQPGSHTIVIRGADGDEIVAQFRFRIER